MLYLGIDQHRKQITVNLRNEEGDVILRRQVSTEWRRIKAFLEQLRSDAVAEGGFVAILEVCGFNDWLLEMLDEYDCQQTVLVQPEKRSKKKTDRRDASALSEVLWVNRLRHNLHQECPTKGMQTKAARKWLAQLSLGPLFPGQGRPTGDEPSACPRGSVGRATGRNGEGDPSSTTTKQHGDTHCHGARRQRL